MLGRRLRLSFWDVAYLQVVHLNCHPSKAPPKKGRQKKDFWYDKKDEKPNGNKNLMRAYEPALRIMRSQNRWFGDPRTLQIQTPLWEGPIFLGWNLGNWFHILDVMFKPPTNWGKWLDLPNLPNCFAKSTKQPPNDYGRPYWGLRIWTCCGFFVEACGISTLAIV